MSLHCNRYALRSFPFRLLVKNRIIINRRRTWNCRSKPRQRSEIENQVKFTIEHSNSWHCDRVEIEAAAFSPHCRKELNFASKTAARPQLPFRWRQTKSQPRFCWESSTFSGTPTTGGSGSGYLFVGCLFWLKNAASAGIRLLYHTVHTDLAFTLMAHSPRVLYCYIHNFLKSCSPSLGHLLFRFVDLGFHSPELLREVTNNWTENEWRELMNRLPPSSNGKWNTGHKNGGVRIPVAGVPTFGNYWLPQ